MAVTFGQRLVQQELLDTVHMQQLALVNVQSAVSRYAVRALLCH